MCLDTETVYAQPHHMLEIMLGWYIGSRTDYSVSCGKQNKYFKRYLPETIYRLYQQTFPDSSYAHFWKSMDASCRLFRETAVLVAESLGVVYPEEYEQGFITYVKAVSGGSGADC